MCVHVFTNVCLYVCKGKREHKREANLSDSIKHLAGLPLTYSIDTNLAFCVCSGMNMSLGSAVSLITLETYKNSCLVLKVLLFGNMLSLNCFVASRLTVVRV